jgi:hypothetical protein
VSLDAKLVLGYHVLMMLLLVLDRAVLPGSVALAIGLSVAVAFVIAAIRHRKSNRWEWPGASWWRWVASVLNGVVGIVFVGVVAVYFGGELSGGTDVHGIDQTVATRLASSIENSFAVLLFLGGVNIVVANSLTLIRVLTPLRADLARQCRQADQTESSGRGPVA